MQDLEQNIPLPTKHKSGMKCSILTYKKPQSSHVDSNVKVTPVCDFLKSAYSSNWKYQSYKHTPEFSSQQRHLH